MNILSDKWLERYLDLAYFYSNWSKDPSTKVGAVIVDDEGRVLSTGYNGFPRNISDHDERLYNREEKYKFVVHAEMNAIYNASYHGISLRGSTLFVCSLPICNECAKGVVQVGIQNVVVDGRVMDKLAEENSIWIDKFKDSRTILQEGGVNIRYFNGTRI